MEIQIRDFSAFGWYLKPKTDEISRREFMQRKGKRAEPRGSQTLRGWGEEEKP